MCVNVLCTRCSVRVRPCDVVRYAARAHVCACGCACVAEVALLSVVRFSLQDNVTFCLRFKERDF